jgi:shikimate 5-dehydrogenase
MTRYFTFVGVTTGQSSIVRIFPRWRDILHLGDDIEVQGKDLPVHAPTDRYREVVDEIKNDPNHVGGLVTTHKLDLYHATADMFAGVDEYASLCSEVSCIAKRDSKLYGWAKDPISAGKSLESILGTNYFGRTGGHVLCYGAGGSGVAISLYLMTLPEAGDRPERMIITNRSPERLDNLRKLHATIESDVEFEYVQSADPPKNDALMEQLPPGSLVINATGMGKDSPGSPVSDQGRFPENGIAWEINYRGDLGFLYQAWNQRQDRKLRVEDGWEYFIYGWTCVMEEVFDIRFIPSDIKELSTAAEFARPPLPTNEVAP